MAEAPSPQWHIDVQVEEIDAVKYSNPSIASGSFGDVKIALYLRRKLSSVGAKDRREWSCTDNSGSAWGYAAIKTIRNAIVPSSVGAGFGGAPRGLLRFAGATNTSIDDHTACTVNNNATSDTKPQLTREAFAELSALRSLSGKHQCIVPLLAVYPSTSGLSRGMGLSLAFPYCPIDLSSALRHLRRNVGPQGGMISDSVVKAIFRDIMSALKHCHEHGVVHGDVNPANTVVSDMGRVQLCDFGLSSACPSLVCTEGNDQGTKNANGDEKLPTHALCAINYRAPEIMLGETTPRPSMDIWAAGVILCEVLSLCKVFMGRNDIDQLNRIFDVLGTPSDTLWPTASTLPDFRKIRFDPREPQGMKSVVPRATICDDLQCIIDATVSLDPATRIAAAKCLEMPWFASMPLIAIPRNVLEELIPKELIVSPFLFPDWTDNKMDNVDDVNGAKQRAVALAARRRAQSKSKVRGHEYIVERVGNRDETDFQCRVKANGLLVLLRA